MNENTLLTLTTREALRDFLWESQNRLEERLAFTVGKPLAASLSGPQLRELLDLLLSAAQRRSVQLRRERNGHWRVTVHLVYRLGVRLARDHFRYGSGFRNTDWAYEIDEWDAYVQACRIIEAVTRDNPDPRTLARRLYDELRSRAVYHNLPVGTRDYELVISAAAPLIRRRANCQGFADAYYLLGTLAGLRVGFEAGYKDRALHVWNFILLDGHWRIVDVTSGLFLPDEAEIAAAGLVRESL